MKEESVPAAGAGASTGNTSTGSFGGATPQKSRLGAASANNSSAATEAKKTRPVPQSLLRNTAATAAKSVRTKEE